MATVAELGQKVKAKYPGQYDDMSDADLGQKVKAKYPSDYGDFTDAPKDRIQAGVEAFDKTKAAFESQPRQSMLDSAVEAGKQLGSAVASPITAIPDAVKAVGEFLSNPNEWARRHFDPSQASAGPGAAGVNPLAEAQGAAVAAVLPSVAEGVGSGARAAGSAIKRGATKVLQTPGAPALIEGIPLATGGATMVAHGNPYGLLAGARGVSRTVEGINELRAHLAAKRAAQAPAAATPPAPVEAAQPVPSPAAAAAIGPEYVMPEPAQIPANASPGQLAGFPPRQVLEMSRKIGPASNFPIPETPAEAATKPTKGSTSNVQAAIKAIEDKFPVNPDNPAERVLLANGKPVLTFEVGERAGNLRLKTMKALEPGQGAGSIAMKRILKIADEHGVTAEATASPFGDNPVRMDKDALMSWYQRVGFKPEPGTDPALGYIMREPGAAATKPQVQVIPAPEPEFSSDVYAASARAVKANKLANLLHEHGIPYEDAKLMGEPEWAQLSQAAGVKVPSAESVQLALFELKKLGRKSNLAQMPTKAQAAAEALGDLGTGDSPAEIAATPVKEITKRRVRTKK